LLRWELLLIKNCPKGKWQQKIKGRTFHLPLPLQEILNKLCKNTDPINKNHEIILVRGVPNSKVI